MPSNLVFLLPLCWQLEAVRKQRLVMDAVSQAVLPEAIVDRVSLGGAQDLR